MAASAAWSEDTCTNSTIAGDRDIWEANSFMRDTSYRDQVASFYNLHKSQWDESWGWAKYNDDRGYRWEFVKMMSAATILWMGLDDGPHTQGVWNLGYAGTGPAAPSPAQRPKLAVISRTADSVDIFYRDSSGKLRHKALSGSPWPANTPPPNATDPSVVVSDVVATDKDAYLISSDPVAFARNAETMDVFAISGNYLLHFVWTVASGWSVNNVTASLVRPERVNGSDRYFAYSNLTGIRRTGQKIDLFATDNFAHLIHFSWELDIWFATDLTHTFGKDLYRVRDGVAVAKRADREAIAVVGKNSSKKLLVFEWTNEDGWKAESLATVLERTVDSRPALILPDAVSIFVYYRSDYDWMLAVKLPSWGWSEIDLSGASYVVEGDPVAIVHERFTSDAFIRDINGHVIQNAFRPDSFETRDLTLIGNFPRIQSDPVAMASGGKRADVFANSFGDHLIHYWSSGSDWSAEDMTATARAYGSKFSVDGIYPIRRRDSALNVFSGRRGFNGSTLHFWSLYGRATNPWHSTGDYSNWASGTVHDFRYDPQNVNDDFSANAHRGFGTDNVQMECGSFKETPDVRAATMLHESTHMNYWPFDHQDNRPGTDCSTPCSDSWFSHGTGEAAGKLGSSSKNHSMTQVEVEFLCDLSEFARSDLPASAFSSARGTADFLMSDRILNPPAWTCGLPRPLP